MTDAARQTKLPSSTTLKQIAAETNATPAAEQKKIQTGIASSADSFQVKQESSLFTANPNTGEVRFGDGVSGKRPPTGTDVRLQQAKSEISSYLKGERKEFLGTKEYLLGAQNKKIDEQMKEAGEKANAAMSQATTGLVTGVIGGAISIGSAVGNLKHVASEALSDLAKSNNPALESRYKHFSTLLNDLHTATNPPESKVLQKKSNMAEIEISKQEQKEQNADDEAKASNGHRDQIRDAILDFLNKLHGIDPKI